MKILALLFMALGHSLMVLWSSPEFNFLLSSWVAPFFGVLVGVNLGRTSNPRKYLVRLIFWGLLSQPGYTWAFGLPWYCLNFLLCLGLGLASYFVLSSLPSLSRIDRFFPRDVFYFIYPAHLYILFLLKFS